MTLKFIMMAGVAAAALSGALMTPAIAGNYDDQVEETRALNIQALEEARSQNGSTMPMPPPSPDDENEADGQGGPSFDGPPGPNDMGTDDPNETYDDEADDAGETPSPDEVL